LKNPTCETYAAELERVVKVSKRSLFASLSNLEKNGFLKRREVGKTILYSLKRDNVIAKQMKILLTLSELAVLDQIFKEDKCELYLFGSAARGEDTEKSDIDIIALTEMSKSSVMALLSKARIKNLKPIVYTQMEYAALYKQDKAFYERVEKDKIRLV
jgi:predicted nucleotidyltransferase